VTVEEWDAFGRMVGRLSYRAGWSFEFHPLLAGGIGNRIVAMLHVKWVVPDVHARTPVEGPSPPWGYRPGNVVLMAQPQVYLDEPLEIAVRTLWNAVGELEAHERMELLKCDGEPLWDAHEGGRLLVTPSTWRPGPLRTYPA
jgi:hypothetical protein